jgi:single-strand DNA-binding protein
MFETPLTVVGNIVNDPIRRTVGDQEVMKFRLASNSRRRGADGKWEAGNSLFVTVNCWGRLVSGVGASLGKGSPVIVVGHIHTSEYEDRDGIRRSTLEMRASSVGPDLSRCIARVEKTVSSGTDAAAGPAPESGPAVDANGTDDANRADSADAAAASDGSRATSLHQKGNTAAWLSSSTR